MRKIYKHKYTQNLRNHFRDFPKLKHRSQKERKKKRKEKTLKNFV